VKPFQSILIPVSLGPTDAELLQYASMVAKLMEPARCHLVHVRGPRTAGTTRQFQAALDLLADENWCKSIERPRCQVVEGALEDRLLEFARQQEIDLILMGHQRQHSRRRALGRRLAMHAPCSVWIAPEGSPARLDRILVAVDFAPNSADALRVAAGLARSSGANRVSALHVSFNDAAVTFDEYEAVLDGEERSAMKAFLAPLDLEGVDVDPIFEEAAQVATAIDRVADRQGVDLVVMNTRGRSASAAVLLGSQTENVLIETERPLLAVKHQGAHLNVLDALLDRRFRSKGVRFG